MASLLEREDQDVYEMIRRADTIGVFQIESRAQMSMLPRLRPRNYYDLVVQISIVRPGPISGGMVHPYLRRRSGEEPVTYPHECLEPVLRKTMGVPLFQEQVMRLAIVAADYTPGEADQLRRDMAAWRRSGRLERHRERLISRMQAKGIAPEFAERVFQQIQGFGEYGFPESHAASFALISYASAYLRCHYPSEFVCSLLNAQPMGFYSIATIVEDGKRLGVQMRPVDITRSQWHSTLEGPEGQEGQDVGRDGADGVRGFSPAVAQDGVRGFSPAVRMGLRFVKSLSEAEGDRIVKARAIAPFTSIEDVARRTGLDEGAMRRLSEAGAFEPLAMSRRAALWETPVAVRDARLPLPFLEGREGQDGRKDEESREQIGFPELSEGETIAWDYRVSSHSVRGHPLAPLRPMLTKQGLPDARTLRGMPTGARVRYAGLVICRQRPATASNVTFMTLEDETGFVNLVLWDRVFQAFPVLARTAHWLGVTGKIDSQKDVVHVIVDELWVPKGVSANEHGKSRDFH
jgi:error-prone DNA polymerase